MSTCSVNCESGSGSTLGEQAAQPGTAPVFAVSDDWCEGKMGIIGATNCRSGEVVVAVFLAPERAAEKDPGQVMG